MTNRHLAAIRPYTETDSEACLSIFDSNVPKYFAATEKSDFAEYLRISSDQILVATADQIVVGCGGSDLRGEIGHLCWGMVHISKHKSSIGSALLATRLDYLFNVGKASEVQLETRSAQRGLLCSLRVSY